MVKEAKKPPQKLSLEAFQEEIRLLAEENYKKGRHPTTRATRYPTGYRQKKRSRKNTSCKPRFSVPGQHPGN